MEEAERPQTVVERDYDHIPRRRQGRSIMQPAGANQPATAMNPDKNRAPLLVSSWRPDIERQTVFTHREPTEQFGWHTRWLYGHRPKLRRLEDAGPCLWRLGRTKAPSTQRRLRIRDPLPAGNGALPDAPHPSLRWFKQRFWHHPFP